METRIFYYSKGSSTFYFTAIVLVAGLSLWALLSDDVTIGKRIFAGILLPGSLYMAYRNFKNSIKPAYKKKPALIMDEKGVYIDDMQITISWDNISSVKMDRVGRQGDWIFLYIINKHAISYQLNRDFSSDYINIIPFDYADGWAIFDALKAFCGKYRPSEVLFSGYKPETWPSEG